MTEPVASDVQGPEPQDPELSEPDPSELALTAPLYGASFGRAFTRFWRKYAEFTGRASLSEFWWAYLANALIVIAGLVVIGGLGAVLGSLGATTGGRSAVGGLFALLGLTVLIGGLALVVPNLAVQARRLHDANRSALLLLLWLIPYVGFIPVLILALLPTDPRGARFDFGADPSAVPPVQSLPAPASALPAARLEAPRTLLGQPDLSLSPAQRPQAQPADEQTVSAVPAPEPTPEPTAADARRAMWSQVGAVQGDVVRHLLPPAGSGPDWPGVRRGFVRVSTADGLDVVASDGLTDGAGAGLGAEVYVAVQRSAAEAGWRAALLVQTAQNIAHGGVRLREQLQQHGALSLSLPAIDAPAEWRGVDGAVGALLGVPLPGVPTRIVLPDGSATLVGVVPLRPDELQRILTEGPPARAEIARALSALSPRELTAPERPSTA